MRITRMLVLFCCVAACASAETLTLPLEKRPAWLSEDGIVMAGSWEPLPFRVRRDGAEGYTPTAEQLAGYRREQSPEMILELKALGVNFVMMHCYKGGGLQAERESMQDAVRFSKLCHDAGLRVGVYNYSGAFIWETFFPEMPQARDWLLLDADGKPLPYSTHWWRYFWNRNHPEAQAFYRKLVKFAVEDIQTDVIHFDNHDVGPQADACSIDGFRRYLVERFTLQQREAMGMGDIQSVRPPLKGSAGSGLRRAWLDFASQSLADPYWEMTRYARTLRPDILMECNPGGPGVAIHPPVDHARLLAGGEAFWDEGRESGFRDGKLHTRIRTYKIGRRMNNIAFAYVTSPVEAAESMAFNLDCLGCICWFEFGNIVSKPASGKPVSADLAPYVAFYHERRSLLRNASVVADVAVLRSFPSQAFGDPACRDLTGRVEQAMIEQRVPFQIVYDAQLNELARYRVLVLAGCIAMSDRQIEQVKQFVQSGGRLCIVGPAGTHDEWMMARPRPAFDDLAAECVRRIDANGDAVEGARALVVDGLAVSVDTIAPGVCMELTRQANRLLVHLVNYRDGSPAENVHVRVRVPQMVKTTRVRLCSPDVSDDVSVPFEQQGGMVSFAVSKLNVYAIAVVEYSNQ